MDQGFETTGMGWIEKFTFGRDVIRVWIRETAVNMVHVSVTRDGRLSFQNTRMNGRAVCLISDSLNSKELFRDEAAPR